MTLDDRLRMAYLSEYLSARRLREEAAKKERRADEWEAEYGAAPRWASLDRASAERYRAVAAGTVEVCERVRHVLRDGGR